MYKPSEFLQKKLQLIPNKPGVYIYKNDQNEIIYVGKAVNLKRRVFQYFQRDDALGPKTLQLVSNIKDIEIKIVGSEIEALILESSLIKKYCPKYNSQLKDDKSYVYISISKDKFPLVTPAFKSNINKNSLLFGPFPNSSAVKSILKTIRHIFPYYSKPHSKNQCLYCHLGLCPGPNITQKDYQKNISLIKSLLRGNFHGLLRELNLEMKKYAKEENYEQAKFIRDQIFSLQYITSGWENLNNMFSRIDLPEDTVNKAENELITILKPHLHSLKRINRIEAFDISNLGSKYFVGSMVVFNDGKIDNSEYRKFKIYAKETPDDQFMIREVVWRRLRHPEWTLPDIILVDGGKPQVSAASKALSFYNNNTISLIGLAKKQETIVIKTDTNWVEVNLPRNSQALRLLQQLRDEAHRFANRYRKELIKKAVLPN